MSYDGLSTSGISSMVAAFSDDQSARIITPLTTRKSKFQNLSSAWGTLSSKLNSLNTILSDLKSTTSSSIFNSKSAASTNTGFVAATATSSASMSSYALRVSQLAKSDIAVSRTFTSNDAGDVPVTAGIHTLKIGSGDYETNLDVEFTGSENAAAVMQKVSDAINADSTAKVSSNKKQSDSGNITIDASNKQFTINVNGTDTTVTLEEGTGLTYNDVMDRMVNAINGTVPGVSVEKVTTNDGSNNYSQLILTASNSSNYVSIDNTGQSLLQDLNISANKERGAASILSASTFSPVSGYSKFSLTAKNSGFSNKLNITSDNAFDVLGMNSALLSNRYKNSDDGTTVNDTKAGFVYGTQYLDNSLVLQGSAESALSNDLNAKINFNGLNIQRDSNSINDLVDGVTFTLNSVMQASDTTVNINISNNTTQVRSKIDDFIAKFNDAYTYIKTKNSTQVNGTRGLFVGESTAQSILSSLSGNTYSSVPGIPSGQLSMLAQIGIKFDPTSGLSVSDSTKLNDQLANNVDQVKALFNSDNGIANRLSNSLSSYLGSTGVLANLKTTYDTSVSSLTDKITSSQSRIDKEAESLRNRYQQLQSQLANLLNMQSMYSTSGFFGS